MDRDNSSPQSNSPEPNALDEDDLLLIEENAQIFKRGKKRKLVYFDESDEELKSDIHKITQEEKSQQPSPKPKLESNINDDLEDFIVYDDSDQEVKESGNNKIPRQSRYEEDDYEMEDYSHMIDDYAYVSDDEHQEELITEKQKKFEPSELEKYHLTKQDAEINQIDLPERFQRRRRPVEKIEKDMLESEADWIFTARFDKNFFFLRNQFEHLNSVPPKIIIAKMARIIDMIRNFNLEVPFIQHYRKNCFEPYLKPDDLWAIYDMDIEYTMYKERQKNLVALFKQLKQYQEYFAAHPDLAPKFDLGPKIDREEIDLIEKLESIHEVNDYHDYFVFYYFSILHRIQSSYINSEVEALKHVDITGKKIPHNLNQYHSCQKSGVMNLVRCFGLTPAQLCENIRENYPRYVPNKNLIEPQVSAEPYINKYLTTSAAVLHSASYIWALQLAHDPTVRSHARTFYLDNAKISSKPTSRGASIIDISHPFYEFKYLRKKPLRLVTAEVFLKLEHARKDGLVEYTIEAYNDSDKTFVECIKSLYERDEYNLVTQKWNQLRHNALVMCFQKILNNIFEKQLIRQLMDEAHMMIVEKCSSIFQQHINMQPDPHKLENVVFSIILPPYQKTSVNQLMNPSNDGFCCVVDHDGTLVDSFPLNGIISRKDFQLSANQIQKKTLQLSKLEKKLIEHRPVSIILPMENNDSITLQHVFRSEYIPNFKLEHNPPVVELSVISVANLRAKSAQYLEEFPSDSQLFRFSVALARYAINPLLETVELCEDPEAAMVAVPHPLSRMVPKEKLVEAYHRALIDIVNKVGVDIKKCTSDTRYSKLLQYVAGLGPSKAVHIIMELRKITSKLRFRSDLISMLEIGPIVFINCAAFIKIPSKLEYDDKIDPFDNTRIHPESYDIAKKLLAFCFKINVNNQSAVIESMLKILSDPKQFLPKNLEPFYEQLKLDGIEDCTQTVQDICYEFSYPFKDYRYEFEPLSDDQLFWLLGSGGIYRNSLCQYDTEINFGADRIVSGIITGFTYRKPTRNEIKSFEMKYMERKMDNCPFCNLSFRQLNENYDTHVNNTCRGEINGLRARLDNGVLGFIDANDLAEDFYKKLDSDYQIGMSLNGKIKIVNVRKFSVELACRPDDLRKDSGGFEVDKYFDIEAEEAEKLKESERQNRLNTRVTYQKKLVVHPHFKNLTYEEAEDLLFTTPIEFIMRPSSKGPDHMTISIKIMENVVTHIDIKEEEKTSDYNVGKKLFINEEIFEDLDEIYARFIIPYISYVKQAQKHKNYCFFPDVDRIKIENYLKAKQGNDKRHIPYLISVSKMYPGKLFFAYINRATLKLEYLKFTNQGYKVRNALHPSIDSFISWFKEISRNDRFSSMYESRTNTPRYETYGSRLFNRSTTPGSVTPGRSYNWH